MLTIHQASEILVVLAAILVIAKFSYDTIVLFRSNQINSGIDVKAEINRFAAQMPKLRILQQEDQIIEVISPTEFYSPLGLYDADQPPLRDLSVEEIRAIREEYTHEDNYPYKEAQKAMAVALFKLNIAEQALASDPGSLSREVLLEVMASMLKAKNNKFLQETKLAEQEAVLEDLRSLIKNLRPGKKEQSN